MKDTQSESPVNEFERERAYLEQLLATRINFYLVFVSFYFVAVFGPNHEAVSQYQRTIALTLGGVISLVMALSVLRTTALVECVLDEFRNKYPHHPYSSAHRYLKTKNVLLRISANDCIAVLPWGITIAFFILALLSYRT